MLTIFYREKIGVREFDWPKAASSGLYRLMPLYFLIVGALIKTIYSF